MGPLNDALRPVLHRTIDSAAKPLAGSSKLCHSNKQPGGVVLDSRTDDEVLRLWALPAAPAEFQQAFTLDSDQDRWIAHVPPALLDEPLVSLLTAHAPHSRPVKIILLEDGSKLLSGVMSMPCRYFGQGGDSRARHQAPEEVAAFTTGPSQQNGLTTRPCV